MNVMYVMVMVSQKDGVTVTVIKWIANSNAEVMLFLMFAVNVTVTVFQKATATVSVMLKIALEYAAVTTKETFVVFVTVTDSPQPNAIVKETH